MFSLMLSLRQFQCLIVFSFFFFEGSFGFGLPHLSMEHDQFSFPAAIPTNDDPSHQKSRTQSE